MLITKQANISGGHQQVNNAAQPEQAGFSDQYAQARTRNKTTSLQNGLLGASHGIELDTRAQSTAGGADPHLEAVATGHRTAHP